MVRVGLMRREYAAGRPASFDARLPGVTHVQRIALGYNNVYLIPGTAGRVLLDAGPDYRGAGDALLAAIGPTGPATVVATHGHLDHAGLARWWQERGAKVGLGKGDEHFAASPHFGDKTEFAAIKTYAEEIGTPEEDVPGVLRGLAQRRQWARDAASEAGGYGEPLRDGRWPTQLRYRHFTPDRTLVDGDAIEGTSLRVIACPGHTPGNIVLVDANEGWLFSGDQLLLEITPTPGVQRYAEAITSERWRFRSLPRFLDSMNRLASLQFSHCWPGHGEPFGDVQAVITENIAQIEQRTARFLALISERGRGNIYNLCEATYPRALKRRFWQIVATVQGHMDILEERGEVRRVGDGYERTL